MEPITLSFPTKFGFTDDQLFEFCQANRELKIERSAEGKLLIMTPAGGRTSSKNSTIIASLWNWNNAHQTGKVFDSSGGFKLPNNAMRAPDAAWVKRERWEELTEEDQKKFPPLCPDFIIELKSENDAFSDLKSKMQEWMDNGCSLAWLIDADAEKAYIYRPGKTPEEIKGFNRKLSGEAVLKGFELDLSLLK